jgi:hypothetical protein
MAGEPIGVEVKRAYEQAKNRILRLSSDNDLQGRSRLRGRRGE